MADNVQIVLNAFETLAYSGRGARDECPGAEPSFIDYYSHTFAPFCLLRACCVCCVIETGRFFVTPGLL